MGKAYLYNDETIGTAQKKVTIQVLSILDSSLPTAVR
jgi:hypothetical protein